MASLKERLRELRSKHRLTQKDIADFLGISESAYGYYEQGRNDPSLDNIRKLAKKYNVNIAYISGDSNDPSPFASFSVAGQDIELTPEEAAVFLEMRKHPQFNIMFHDLATDPETKVKQLISMWEFIKKQIENKPEDRGDGFGEFADD